MGGISTGGDRESYSVLGMGGTEQLRKAPLGVGIVGRNWGAQGTRRRGTQSANSFSS